MLLQHPTEARLHPEVVDRVVNTVVGQIPHDEACEEWLADSNSDGEAVERVEHDTEGDADSERHDEAPLVARIVVVHAMKKEVDPATARRVLVPVEGPAVK